VSHRSNYRRDGGNRGALFTLCVYSVISSEANDPLAGRMLQGRAASAHLPTTGACGLLDRDTPTLEMLRRGGPPRRLQTAQTSADCPRNAYPIIPAAYLPPNAGSAAVAVAADGAAAGAVTVRSGYRVRCTPLATTSDRVETEVGWQFGPEGGSR
jgi:hypothetical protein